MKAYHFAYLILIMAFGLTCLVFFWLFYPYKPLTIKGEVFTVVNKTVKQGGILYFVSNYCKNFDGIAVTSRAFNNGLIFYVPSQTTAISKGCGTITISVPVPKELLPGKYFLQNIYEYKVNSLRTITIKHNTELFEIVE